GDVLGYGVFQGCRTQDVALALKELVVLDRVGAREAYHRASLLLMGEDLPGVQPLPVEYPALGVARRDQLRAHLLQYERIVRAGVAEALDRDRSALQW